MNSKAKKAEESDYRPPELPADRVLALEAVIDAKGQKLPTPPRCLGYVNCCGCPVCQRREGQLRARLSEVEYLRYIGFDDQPEEELLAA